MIKVSFPSSTGPGSSGAALRGRPSAQGEGPTEQEAPYREQAQAHHPAGLLIFVQIPTTSTRHCQREYVGCLETEDQLHRLCPFLLG